MMSIISPTPQVTTTRDAECGRTYTSTRQNAAECIPTCQMSCSANACICALSASAAAPNAGASERSIKACAQSQTPATSAAGPNRRRHTSPFGSFTETRAPPDGASGT
jgi:hypothetical protein